MPVRGQNQVSKKIGSFFVDVEGKYTEKALRGVMITARGYAMLDTPVDTATLINSIDYSITRLGTATLYYRGGFSEKGFNYAEWLENNENWTPTKKPNAKPHFLRDSFESPDARADIMAVIKASYNL